MARTTTKTGTIKSMHVDKGFGFLKDADGTEYFFHRSACADFDALERGYSVRFTESASSKGKGPRAENVEVI